MKWFFVTVYIEMKSTVSPDQYDAKGYQWIKQEAYSMGKAPIFTGLGGGGRVKDPLIILFRLVFSYHPAH